MKYAILIYAPETGGSDPDVTEEYMQLSRRETTIGGEQLQPSATATTVRVEDGQALTTDGPFVETKEALGGFYLIDVANLDDALFQLACLGEIDSHQNSSPPSRAPSASALTRPW